MGKRKEKGSAIYLRSATGSPEQLKKQKEAIISFAKNKGFKIGPDMVFQDVGSGLARNRTELNSLREKVKAGEITDLFVYDPARLSRDRLSYITLLKEFEKHGCRVLFCRDDSHRWEPVDAQDKFHKFFLSSIEFPGPFLHIGQMVQFGLIAKAKRGLWPAGKPPFGYKTQRGKLTPVPSEARIVRKIYELAKFKRIHKIQETLRRKGSGNIPITRIYFILRSPIYKGDLVWGKKKSVNGKPAEVPPDEWIVVKNAFSPIIDKQKWEQIQLALKNRRRKRRK